jgi:hypothetical protein
LFGRNCMANVLNHTKMRRCGREWPALEKLPLASLPPRVVSMQRHCRRSKLPLYHHKVILLAAARVEGSMRLDLPLADADRVPEGCSGYSRNRGRS